jgi:hypothetical protein
MPFFACRLKYFKVYKMYLYPWKKDEDYFIC